MAGVNTSGWENAAWQEQATPALRLSSLLQHITEVRQAAVEHNHGQGRSQRVDMRYLDQLLEAEQGLRLVVNLQAGATSAPTVTRPQF